MPAGKRSQSGKKAKPVRKPMDRSAMEKTKGGGTASSGAGASTGKVTVKEFTISKITDSASP